MWHAQRQCCHGSGGDTMLVGKSAAVKRDIGAATMGVGGDTTFVGIAAAAERDDDTIGGESGGDAGGGLATSASPSSPGSEYSIDSTSTKILYCTESNRNESTGASELFTAPVF